MSDDRLAGAEALLPWQHPEHGPIAPSVFIDVAEQSGLIEIIGPAVLRAACADAMLWTDEHPDADVLFVSVNVSPRHLRNGYLSEQVAKALADTGLVPQRLPVVPNETAVICADISATTPPESLRSPWLRVGPD